MKIGTKTELTFDEFANAFTPVEGFNTCYYGRVRQGKTYSATVDILELLKRGEVVYANWNIDFQGFDQRRDFRTSLIKFFFGQKKFFNFKASNFHYLPYDEIEKNVPFLGSLVNAHLFLDEGQWLFNSHVRDMDIDKRKLILHGGHYCRTLNVVTQRPTNINKDIRSQINFWYKCEKKLQIGNFILFMRYTYEDMKDDLPHESDREGKELATETKRYFAKKIIFDSYNTHAFRAEGAVEVFPEYEVFNTTFVERFINLLSNIYPFSRFSARKLKRQQLKHIPIKMEKGT